MSKTDETTSIRIATLNLCNYIQPPLACYEYDSIYSHARSVLDYILVSDEFDSHHPGCLADISHYQCIDEHLIRPDYTTDSYSSDHAAVMVTLQLRRYSP